MVIKIIRCKTVVNGHKFDKYKVNIIEPFMNVKAAVSGVLNLSNMLPGSSLLLNNHISYF